MNEIPKPYHYKVKNVIYSTEFNESNLVNRINAIVIRLAHNNLFYFETYIRNENEYICTDFFGRKFNIPITIVKSLTKGYLSHFAYRTESDNSIIKNQFFFTTDKEPIISKEQNKALSYKIDKISKDDDNLVTFYELALCVDMQSNIIYD